jgi:hypothetical protein
MTQLAIRTTWKFVVEFEDEETGEISGTIGRATTREECEALMEYDVEYCRCNGGQIVNAEAGEVCAECEGEGKIIEAGNCGTVICQACGGHVGSIAEFFMVL